MNVLRSPIFIICLLLFIIHQVMQKGLDLHFPLADRYLDNLLAMPVILTLLLVERRWLFKKGEAYTLPLLDVVIATIFIVLITELLFPFLSKSFTSDWMDVVFYSIGSAVFYLTINQSSKHYSASTSNNRKD